MDKKTAFNEALSELVSFATANGNKITMGEVKSHFDGLIDDDSQYRFIYDYLTVNKIEVTGFTPSDENFFGGGDDSASISAQLSKNQFNESKEELDFIEMYLEDIKKYPSISLEEQKTYLAAFLEGDISYYEKWKTHSGLLKFLDNSKNMKCDIYIHMDSYDEAKKVLGDN